MLLKPLQKIKVVKSKRIYKPGSIGYFVAQDNQNNSLNSWNMAIVFTRFGKGGKPRTDLEILSTRMIEYDDMSEKDREILRVVAGQEGIEPRSGHYYTGHNQIIPGDTVIEPIDIDSRNVLDGSVVEMTAYITALSLLVYKLNKRLSIKRLVMRPAVKMKDFADNGFILDSVLPDLLGYYILAAKDYDDSCKRGGYPLHDYPLFEPALRDQLRSKATVRRVLKSLQKCLAMTRIAFNDYKSRNQMSFDQMQDKIIYVLKHYRRSKKAMAQAKAYAEPSKVVFTGSTLYTTNTSSSSGF